jgi:hypothetical protein
LLDICLRFPALRRRECISDPISFAQKIQAGDIGCFTLGSNVVFRKFSTLLGDRRNDVSPDPGDFIQWGSYDNGYHESYYKSQDGDQVVYRHVVPDYGTTRMIQ